MNTSSLTQKDHVLKQLLNRATDATQCEPLLAKYLPSSLTRKQAIQISHIAVLRYKHGKRCLIEYSIVTATGSYHLLGKIRAKGLHKSVYRINQHLYQGGFGLLADNDWRVPEPMCLIPELNMWLQKRVVGVEFTQLITNQQPQAEQWARKIACMSHALHQTAFSVAKSHSPVRELDILKQQFAVVTKKKPMWQSDIDYLYHLLTPLIEPLLQRPSVCIHRDFYPDQVMVDMDSERLYLLDLDLVCIGDPCLDIGNFVAHIQEQALREQGDIKAYQHIEAAMIQSYLQLSDHPSSDVQAIQLYSTLSLARHVAISQRISSRNHLTETLLSLAIGQARALA